MGGQVDHVIQALRTSERAWATAGLPNAQHDGVMPMALALLFEGWRTEFAQVGVSILGKMFSTLRLSPLNVARVAIPTRSLATA